MCNVLMLRDDLASRGLEFYGEPSAIVAVKTGDEALARLAEGDELVRPLIASAQQDRELGISTGRGFDELEAIDDLGEALRGGAEAEG